MSINETIEQEIINALKKDFTEFDVESYPKDFENFTFTSPTGCLLVKYVQTSFSEQTTIWDVNQDAETVFEIIACYRTFDKYIQIHSPQQRIKNTLQGLEILGRKIVLEKEEFLKEINTDIFCKIRCKIKHY